MSDITRIMDLPENITMQMTQGTRGDGINTSYSPIDMHPNPYGHPPPSMPSMPTPTTNNPNQRLPSRDIPQDPSYLVQDAEVLANYIPPVTDGSRKTAEYMRQYDEANDKKIYAHKKEKETKTRVDKLAEDGQIPILIAMLFFMFHMPIVDNYMTKTFSFLSILDVDGNFNMNGLIMRSVTFGFMFHAVTHLINTLSLL